MASRQRTRRYPFSAIVGQETLKTALLLNAVDPRIGGVLIRGHRGTAKSTSVRALVGVLPQVRVVTGCPFSCDPGDPSTWCDTCRERARNETLPSERRTIRIVDLPVSATEDRLVGTLDLEHALQHGERRFEPGLLAAANRGILYVDEVNLLDDHLVDTLLDAAAMGVNVVEREGVSFSHPARFILVGTMNPEEGEVRPQLLDRFGLCAEVEGLADPDQRVEVVRRRQAYEDDPEAFCSEWSAEETSASEHLEEAGRRRKDVRCPDDVLHLIADVANAMGVDGHRADIVMARAAQALAALEGEPEVDPGHIQRIAPLVLAHRLRRQPFDEPALDERRLEDALAGSASQARERRERDTREPTEGAHTGEAAVITLYQAAPADPGGATPGLVPPSSVKTDGMPRSATGKRQETRSEDRRGRYTRAEPWKPGTERDIAIDATLREAALHQKSRGSPDRLQVERSDIRNKVRKRRVGASIVFCVDASGSMGVSTRMEAAKAAVLDLLVDAYQRRDRVGLVSFRGSRAEVVLAPTASVELAHVRLRSLAAGGATPLAHGIRKSLELLAQEMRRDESVIPWLVLVTDGRANVGIADGLGSEDARRAASDIKGARIHSMVIDTDPVPSGAARDIARLAGGTYLRLPQADGVSMSGAVRSALQAPEA